MEASPRGGNVEARIVTAPLHTGCTPVDKGVGYEPATTTDAVAKRAWAGKMDASARGQPPPAPNRPRRSRGGDIYGVTASGAAGLARDG